MSHPEHPSDYLVCLRLRPHLHRNVCVYALNSFAKKSTHAHLTCPFTRDRWKRCSTYAGPVSGAVTSAPKYTKGSEEDPPSMVAMVAWLPFCLFSAVDLATCSSCCSPCPLVADGCGRGAVDFALTSVSWSVAFGARKQPCDPPLLLLVKHISNDAGDAGVSSRGGERRGYGVLVIRK